jgi:acyl-ACP thioesterase
MELKNFVDFAYSLINMDEVKDGVFQIPDEIVFDLGREKHVKIHEEIKKEKGSDEYLNLEQEFDVEIFDITFRFKLNEEEN